MSRIKAGLELAEEIKQEEQLAEIQQEPTEETVEEFQEESIEETIASIEESFNLAVEGIWGDFKRDFLGSKPRGGSTGDHFKRLAQSYARKSAEAKDMHDMETALQYRDLSWYYSLMSGNPPQNIKDPDQFKYDVEHNPALKMHIDRELKNARINELKEPKDNDESDNDTYLQNLTRKKVRKEYEKSLPKGHTSLAKKYNLEEVSDELIDRYRKKKNAQMSNIIGKAKGDQDAKVFTQNDVDTIKKRMRGTDLDLARNRRSIEKNYNLKESYGDTLRLEAMKHKRSGNMALYYKTMAKYHEHMAHAMEFNAEHAKNLWASQNYKNQSKKHLRSMQVFNSKYFDSKTKNNGTSDISLNEDYDDRLRQVVDRLKSRIQYTTWTKADLERAIRGEAYDVVDMKLPGTAKEFMKDVYKAIKPLVKWKKTQSTKPQIDYKAIGNMIMNAIGQTFPDGDPIDTILPKLRKMGINTENDVEKLLDKSLKSIGYPGGYYNTMADMWDDMKSQSDYDAQHGHQSHLNLGDKNPWRMSEAEEAGETTNPKDKVTLDVPLLIRLLEYAREDAKSDMDLHDLTEKLVAMGSESGKTLSMSDYDQLVSNQEETYEAKNPAIARTKAIAKMQKNAPSFKKAMEKGEKKDIKEAKGKPIEFLPYVLQNARNTFSDMEAIEDLFDYTYLEDLKFDEIIQGMENERKTAAKYISPRLSWLLKNMHDKAYLGIIKPLAIKWMREMSPLLDDYVGRIIDKSPNY